MNSQRPFRINIVESEIVNFITSNEVLVLFIYLFIIFILYLFSYYLPEKLTAMYTASVCSESLLMSAWEKDII